MTETYQIQLPYEILKLFDRELEKGETNYARFIQENFDALRKSVELYGMRSIMPYSWDVNFDSTHSAELYFWMPTKTDRVNSCKVKVLGQNYRGYSGSIASGGSGATGAPSPSSTGTPSNNTTGTGGTGSTGGQSQNHTHSVNSHNHSITNSSQSTGGSGADVTGNTSGVSPDVAGNSGESSGHTHTSGSYACATHTHGSGGLACASHTHSYTRPPSSTGNASPGTGNANQGHTHSGPSHTHSMQSHTHSLNSHTHGVGNHTHNLTLSISESTDPTGVNVYIDDGDGYSASLASDNTPVDIEVDVASSLSTDTGWKKVKITSSRLGRASITLILDCNILRI